MDVTKCVQCIRNNWEYSDSVAFRLWKMRWDRRPNNLHPTSKHGCAPTRNQAGHNLRFRNVRSPPFPRSTWSFRKARLQRPDRRETRRALVAEKIPCPLRKSGNTQKCAQVAARLFFPGSRTIARWFGLADQT